MEDIFLVTLDDTKTNGDCEKISESSLRLSFVFNDYLFFKLILDWHYVLGVGRALSMLGCSLDTRWAFFGPKIGRFSAKFWLNLGKIMGLFDTKKFLYIFGWKLAQNRPILGPFLAEYVA